MLQKLVFKCDKNITHIEKNRYLTEKTNKAGLFGLIKLININ